MKYLTALFILTSTLMVQAQIIPLYDGAIPNSRPVKNGETSSVESDGVLIIRDISKPTLEVFLPPAGKGNGTAVVICPGGGYWVNAYGHEGTDVAKMFNAMGVAAFVLKYRIPNDKTMISREIGPLQDAQQAIRVVRKRAKEWKLNPARIGIMGFSAGGHLASTAGTHFETITIDNPDQVNLRPDFMILIYPVISFQDSTAHIGSRDQLIGKNPLRNKMDLYSNELQITPRTPPTFLMHASDDDVVKSENSVLFYQHLLQNKVPAELHIYQRGGHGFGMYNKTTSVLWMDQCQAWLASNGWLTK